MPCIPEGVIYSKDFDLRSSSTLSYEHSVQARDGWIVVVNESRSSFRNMIITCSLIPHGFALAWLAWRTSTSRRSNSSSSNSLSSNSNTAVVVVVVLELWSSFTYGRGARVPVSSASCLLCFFLLYGNQLILLIERKHSKIYLSRHMLVGIRALLCCGQIMAIPLHAIRVWQHYNVWLIGLIGGDRRAKPKPKDTILPSFAHK